MSCGTVEERQMPSTRSRSTKLRYSAHSSSPLRLGSVAIRQCSVSSAPRNRPNTVCVLPTSTASSMRPSSQSVDYDGSLAGRPLQVVVRGQALADLLGERLGGQARLVAVTL